MGVSDDVDKTLFVGNLDPKVTEELLFELFLQAGPLINVKIPKDNEGKPKMFAFVNFKHEESVPYGMSLLSGIRLYGRPLKVQFRPGSSHVSPDANSPGNSQSPSPCNTPSHRVGRYNRPMDPTDSPTNSPPPLMLRNFSSPENLQRQALMNLWQLQATAVHLAELQDSSGYRGSWQPDVAQGRVHRHPLKQNSRHNRESERHHHHRGEHPQQGDFYHHDDRSGRQRDNGERRREGPRDARVRRY